MKGIIEVTQILPDGDCREFYVPITGMVFGATRGAGELKKGKSVFWFEPIPNEGHESFFYVRETPAQIAAMIAEAQAPTVDEIAVELAPVLCHNMLHDIRNGLCEEHINRDHNLLGPLAYAIADALVAERKRRREEGK